MSWNRLTTWVAYNHGQDHDQICVVNIQTSSRVVGYFSERDSELILETVSAHVKSGASTYYVELQNIIMILGHEQLTIKMYALLDLLNKLLLLFFFCLNTHL